MITFLKHFFYGGHDWYPYTFRASDQAGLWRCCEICEKWQRNIAGYWLDHPEPNLDKEIRFAIKKMVEHEVK